MIREADAHPVAAAHIRTQTTKIVIPLQDAETRSGNPKGIAIEIGTVTETEETETEEKTECLPIRRNHATGVAKTIHTMTNPLVVPIRAMTATMTAHADAETTTTTVATSQIANEEATDAAGMTDTMTEDVMIVPAVGMMTTIAATNPTVTETDDPSTTNLGTAAGTTTTEETATDLVDEVIVTAIGIDMAATEIETAIGTGATKTRRAAAAASI